MDTKSDRFEGMISVQGCVQMRRSSSLELRMKEILFWEKMYCVMKLRESVKNFSKFLGVWLVNEQFACNFKSACVKFIMILIYGTGLFQPPSLELTTLTYRH